MKVDFYNFAFFLSATMYSNLILGRVKDRYPVRRSCLSYCEGEDGGGTIRTLDELYTHCEQLVETLSQVTN